jgi:biotin operon repressor
VTPALLAYQLGLGAHNARSIGDIAEASGCSRREVEQAVEEARRAGFPLVAGQRGVWVATSVDELVNYEQRLRSRVRSQMAGVRGVRRAIAAWRGQLRLWDAA